MRAQDATAIGTIGIIMGWWNAFNGPFVARWADSGALNRRVPCFASCPGFGNTAKRMVQVARV